MAAPFGPRLLALLDQGVRALGLVRAATLPAAQWLWPGSGLGNGDRVASAADDACHQPDCARDGQLGYTGASHGAVIISAADDFTGRYLAGPMVAEHLRSIHKAPVILKRYSMIGAAAVVLPGVTLGEGSIVGAHSYARKSIPEWTIWFGVPAKQVAKRRKDLLKLLAVEDPEKA